MKYYEVKFAISTADDLRQTASDILSAIAAEAGFETFEETPDGLTGYVQQALFARDVLDLLIATFPLPHCTIEYEVSEAEDKDWNEQWEQEGFQPIIIGNRCVIHDGRHTDIALTDYEYSIEIDARLAFGTGTHETTRMIVDMLLNIDIADKRVLDCGTGTGILSIAALKMGAASATGYDIDEWSVDNARHNAIINRVDNRFYAFWGDASLLLNKVEGVFDIIIANINRNILLADMLRFQQSMAPNAILILSGFYLEDTPLLTSKATELGMIIVAEKEDNGWACLMFRN